MALIIIISFFFPYATYLFGVDVASVLILFQAVKKGDTIFIGQYLFTGSETTSVWLEVRKSTKTSSIVKADEEELV